MYFEVLIFQILIDTYGINEDSFDSICIFSQQNLQNILYSIMFTLYNNFFSEVCFPLLELKADC